MKRVLNISKRDAIGRRFTNLDLAPRLAQHSWHSTNCAWHSSISPDLSLSTKNGLLRRLSNRVRGEVARAQGNINGYFQNAETITSLPDYQAADVLHFHIMHEKWLSLRDWKLLARDKAVVWTWHDPYMVTGHCLHPIECDRFQTGCLTCPDLKRNFAIKRDRSHKNLLEKVAAVREIDPLVIVASPWMRDVVERSLYGPTLRVKTIPFGVEFSTQCTTEEARSRLGLSLNHIVLGFRAVNSEYKGFELLIQALEGLHRSYPHLPLAFIAFEDKGMCPSFENKIPVIEPGWVGDDSMQMYYRAMDFFLMPSRAETFGLMAIEAMISGACPIVTHGTSLAHLVHAPVHGIAVEHTVEALQNALQMACLNVGLYKNTSEARIQFAKQAYNIDIFSKELAATYDEEIEYRSHTQFSARQESPSRG